MKYTVGSIKGINTLEVISDNIHDYEGYASLLNFPIKPYGKFQLETDSISSILDPVNRYLSTLSEHDSRLLMSYLLITHSNILTASTYKNKQFDVFNSDTTIVHDTLIKKLRTDFIQLNNKIGLIDKLKYFIETDEEMVATINKFSDTMVVLVKEFRKINERFNKKDILELIQLVMLSKILIPIFGSILTLFPSRYDICISLILDTVNQYKTYEKMKQYVFFNITSKLNKIKDDMITNTYEAHVRSMYMLNVFIVKNMANVLLMSDKGNLLTYFLYSTKREVWNITQKYKKTILN